MFDSCRRPQIIRTSSSALTISEMLCSTFIALALSATLGLATPVNRTPALTVSLSGEIAPVVLLYVSYHLSQHLSMCILSRISRSSPP